MPKIELKDAINWITCGVYVLGVHTPEKDNLMTAAWACPVSGKPPMLMVAVGSTHLTAELIGKAQGFAVSVLAAEQYEVAARNGRITGRNGDKLAQTAVTYGFDGHPFVDGAAAWLDCKLIETVASVNHTLFFAEITGAKAFSGTPMLYKKELFF